VAALQACGRIGQIEKPEAVEKQVKKALKREAPPRKPKIGSPATKARAPIGGVPDEAERAPEPEKPLDPVERARTKARETPPQRARLRP
jgi:hypothetical protein